MAIQVRRGNYADLDTSRLVQGEPFVTLDQTDGDYYVGMTIAPSRVVRLATWSNLVNIRDDCEQFSEVAEKSAISATQSEKNAKESETKSEDYCNRSEFVWEHVDTAVKRINPTISLDFETGMLSYDGSFFDFVIDDRGHLNWGIAI